jgi:prefoldin subunit 5
MKARELKNFIEQQLTELSKQIEEYNQSITESGAVLAALNNARDIGYRDAMRGLCDLLEVED